MRMGSVSVEGEGGERERGTERIVKDRPYGDLWEAIRFCSSLSLGVGGRDCLVAKPGRPKMESASMGWFAGREREGGETEMERITLDRPCGDPWEAIWLCDSVAGEGACLVVRPGLSLPGPFSLTVLTRLLCLSRGGAEVRLWPCILAPWRHRVKVCRSRPPKAVMSFSCSVSLASVFPDTFALSVTFSTVSLALSMLVSALDGSAAATLRTVN